MLNFASKTRTSPEETVYPWLWSGRVFVGINEKWLKKVHHNNGVFRRNSFGLKSILLDSLLSNLSHSVVTSNVSSLIGYCTAGTVLRDLNFIWKGYFKGFFKFPQKNENLANKSKIWNLSGFSLWVWEALQRTIITVLWLVWSVEKKEELSGATSHWESVNRGDTSSSSIYWHHSARIE